MLRTCFVCLPAAPVIDPGLGGPVGGTETRAWLFARTLARRDDTEVTFLVRYRTSMDGVVEGVTIRTIVDRVFNLFEQVGLCVARRPGFPWLRVRRWRPQLLWQFPAAVAVRLWLPRRDPTLPDRRFQGIDCDVFCTFGVQTVSATVIASAHAAGRPAVLVLGSDGDLDPKFLSDPKYVNPYGDRAADCRFILEKADVIVCQTGEQQRLLKERFGREGVVVENPIDLEECDRVIGRQGEPALQGDAGEGRQAEPALRGDVGEGRQAEPALRGASFFEGRAVLWVGRAEGIHKRPMLAVEIANRCPEVPFLLVMNPRDPAEEARVRAAAPSNVVIRERVPPQEMPRLMASSLALLNTSSLEGFPNTFLQAGAARVPIISLEVGERFLKESGSGIYCQGEIDRAVRAIRTLTSDPVTAMNLGLAGRQWVKAHHDATERASELREVLWGVGRR